MKWTIFLILLGWFAIAGVADAQNMTGEVVPQAQNVLDAYFVTNAIPGQLAYWELIDTMYWYINSTYTNSLAAAQSAAASAAASGKLVSATMYVQVANGGPQNNYWFSASYGFTSNVFIVSGNNFVFTNYFAQPVTNQFAYYTWSEEPPAGFAWIHPQPSILTPTTISVGATNNYFWIHVNDSPGAGVNGTNYLHMEVDE